jgi:hypothetical protein
MTEIRTSYYIPRIEINTSIEEVLNEFGLIGLGIPTRVDFVYLKNNDKWKSAFVHSLFNINESNVAIYTHIQCGNQYRWHFHNNQNKKYWIILKTKTNPAINCESAINFDPVKNLESDKIAQLTDQVNNLRHVVYQMVIGLYCPITQMSTLNSYVDILYPQFQSNDDITMSNTSRWRNTPTTPQADSCERRISELEERVNTLSAKFINDDNDLSSTSSHSSMPSLVSASSDSDNYDDDLSSASSNSSLTWLEDVDSIVETGSL